MNAPEMDRVYGYIRASTDKREVGRRQFGGSFERVRLLCHRIRRHGTRKSDGQVIRKPERASHDDPEASRSSRKKRPASISTGG